MSTPDPTPSLITVAAAQFAGVGWFQNSVPETAQHPYVWLQVTGSETWDVIADDTEIFRWFVTAEVTDLTPDAAFDLAEQIKNFLGKTQPGPFGAGTVQGVRVTDQSDDYEIRQMAADSRGHYRALEIQVINYKES